MSVRFNVIGATVLSGALLLTATPVYAQAAAEVFSATATVKSVFDGPTDDVVNEYEAYMRK